MAKTTKTKKKETAVTATKFKRRLPDSELEAAIHQPKKNNPVAKVDKSGGADSTCYTVAGKVISAGKPEVYAQEVNHGDRSYYYVKKSPSSRLYNPFDSNMNRMSGPTRTYPLRAVTKEVFDLYLKFLKTKNKAWLLNAERAVR